MQTSHNQPGLTSRPSVTQYLRLYPSITQAYKSIDSDFWMAIIPAESGGMAEVVCSGSGDNEIMRLLHRGVLVPVIDTYKEYITQKALGTVDHRTYRLESKIAAKYQFCYDTLMTLSMIESITNHCNYNIFDDARGLPSDGQPHLEILPKDDTIVRDYQDKIITDPLEDVQFVDKYSFVDMVQRGIIILQGTKWKLSRNYWEFKL